MSVQTPDKAIIYSRVAGSTSVEREAGHASQQKQCHDYAERQGYSIAATFRDDGSGNTLDRTGLKAMLAFLREHRHEPHVVFVADVHRIARNIGGQMQLCKEIARSGGVIQVTEQKRFLRETEMQRERD